MYTDQPALLELHQTPWSNGLHTEHKQTVTASEHVCARSAVSVAWSPWRRRGHISILQQERERRWMRVSVSSEWKQNLLMGSLESRVWALEEGVRMTERHCSALVMQVCRMHHLMNCSIPGSQVTPFLCGASATQRGAASQMQWTVNGQSTLHTNGEVTYEGFLRLNQTLYIFGQNTSDAGNIFRFHSVYPFLFYWKDRESCNGAKRVPDLMKWPHFCTQPRLTWRPTLLRI